MFERGKPEENLDLFKQMFLIKPVKGHKYEQFFFSTQSEPHTAKPCHSVALKHFWGNSTELFFLDIKMTISETITEILRNLFFLPCLKGENPEETQD